MESKKNIGIWIRVSTDMQVKDDSPEHHEQRARMYAEAKGWNVITVYRLEAMSGKSVMNYAETKRMLKDIHDGIISGLIFSKLARLTRNTKELLEFSDIFRGYNADLISLGESIDTSTPAGRMFYTMIAAMAQWEREEIAERVKASIPIRVKMGKPLSGSTPYGYTWVNKEFVIDPQTAPVRKLMYEIFLKTKRKKTTAKELNSLGYRTNTGKEFTNTTIGRLLRDPSAKGIRRANYTTGDGTISILKPQSEWLEIPCPPLVSEEMWEACNKILDDQKFNRIPMSKKTVHLLAGFVMCACGNKMYVFNEAPVYKCKKCRRKIDVSDIDDKEGLLKQQHSELAKLKKRLAEMIDLRLDGELSKDRFKELYTPLEEQMQQIETQLPELEAEVDFLKIQYLSAGTVLQEAKDLYNNWDQLPFPERRSIVETIT